jgi:hypothetical protein
LPVLKRTQKWEETLKEDVRSLGRGWSIQEHKGKMRLKWRYVPNQKDQSILLPFLWESSQRKAATTRIGNIYNLTLQGHDLKTAAKIADGKAPKIQTHWSQYLENFKRNKFEHGTSIGERTWTHDYFPVLKMAVDLLEGRQAPVNPADLIDACIRDWKTGSSTRKRRTNNLCQFLNYCVARENVPVSWTPPIDRKDHVGRKARNAKSQKKHPITDKEITDLIEAISTTDSGIRWGNALKLIAEYGLRPIEIRYLHVRTDSKTGDSYLWCSYEKRAGGGVTKPRRLEPLPIEGTEWNLLPLLKAKLIELPKLDSKFGVGETARKYLERKSPWNSLKAKVEGREESLGTYSLRHSYSVRGHLLGIDSGSMATAMGHSLEVHCREYPWATSETTTKAFQRARSLSLPHSP